MKKAAASFGIVLCILLLWDCICFFVPFREPQHREIDTTKETVHVYFNINDDYAKYLAVTLASILENTDSPLHFYVLHSGVSEENQNKIRQLKKIRDFDIDFIKFSEEKYGTLVYRSVFSISEDALMRLYITDYIRNIDKMIYLDVDLVVLSDIANLYHINLENNYVAAIQDPYYFLDENKKYFNSGVMVVNLQRWRKDNITKKFDEIYWQYAGRLIFVDQDVLNLAFDEKVIFLPDKYNADINLKYTNKQRKKAAFNNPCIIHWAGKPKPWDVFWSKRNNLFWKYAELTPFYAQIRYTYLINHFKYIYQKIIGVL